MRHIFIINPAAGKKDRSVKLHKEIVKACRKHEISPLIFISEYAGYEKDMTRRMCSLFSNEEIRFYSCGGSGTLANVISGINNFEHTEVAYYPCGRTNDFLKTFGKTANRFCSIENLITGETKPLDFLTLNGFRSINYTCLGMQNNFINTSTILQFFAMIHPTIAYTLSTFAEVIRDRCDEYELIIDGKNYSGFYSFILFFNGTCTSGDLIPPSESLPDNGYMNIIMVKNMSRLGQLKFFYNFSHSRLNKMDPCIHIVKAKTVSITRKEEDNDESLTFNCDGEVVSADGQSAVIKLRPRHLKFIVPEGAELVAGGVEE